MNGHPDNSEPVPEQQEFPLEADLLPVSDPCFVHPSIQDLLDAGILIPDPDHPPLTAEEAAGGTSLY